MKNHKIALIHPGEILNEEFLAPLGISQSKLARDIDVPHRRINEIVLGKRAISTDTAIRFSIYFKTTAVFWLNLQTHYDLTLLQKEQMKRYKKIASFAELATSL